jgi:malonyl-CoA O-methyltransferase
MALASAYLDKYQVIQSFNRAAAGYEQWAQIQESVGHSLLERLKIVNLEPQRVLDVGAGSGRLTKALKQFYSHAEIYGIDISLAMSKMARQNTKATVEFVCADAVQLPVANDSVDLLVSNLMLQWCNDLHLVFAEWERVLQPKGKLFFTTLGPDTLKELRQSWAAVDNVSHLNYFFDLHEVGDALFQAGFAHTVVDVEWLQLTYQDVNQLMRELKGIGAHNVTAGRSRGLTGKGKLQAMITAYEQLRLPIGKLPATYEVVYGYAWGKRETSAITIPLSQIGRR